MPKFMITTNAGDGAEGCDEALEFPYTKAATDDAQIALVEMAREKLPNGKRADFGVQVENADGKEVYRAGLRFEAKTEEDIDRDEEEADAAVDEIAANLGSGPRK